MNIVASLFRPAQPVPPEYRSNFKHLYLDVAWFGILSGSVGSFLAVYAARLGADPTQLGMLSAAPAIINLIFAFPAGRWLEKHAGSKPVFWSAVVHRGFYAALIALPWLLNDPSQITAILLVTFIMNIPGSALAVGFNAIFADTVPSEWRAHVAGVRNSILSVVTIVTSLLCGQILIRVPFPVGYQIVFAMGFLGAMGATSQLWYLRPAAIWKEQSDMGAGRNPVEDDPPVVIPAVRNGRRNRFITGVKGFNLIRVELLKGHFGRVIGLLFCFHLAQFLAIPLFSIYMVDVHHFSDQVISFGSAMFNLTVFAGSTQLARMSWRLGHRNVTGIGIVLLSFYPALMAYSRDANLFMITSFVGGVAWSLCGGALYNYLADSVPEGDRPAHMAWYNLGLNGAILIGSLAGPLIADQIGLPTAMIVFAFARLFSGIAILVWG